MTTIYQIDKEHDELLETLAVKEDRPKRTILRRALKIYADREKK